MPRRFTEVIGDWLDPALAEALHSLEHAGCVEYLDLGETDLSRKRLRVRTDRGTDCAIALPRDKSLHHGAVLALEADHAIVVRLERTPWLVLEGADRAASLRLGFLAGHHHWRTRFDGNRLEVALDQPRERYLERLETCLEEGSVRVIDEAPE